MEEIKIPILTFKVPDEIKEEFAMDMMREALSPQALAVSIIVKHYRRLRRQAVEKHLRDYGAQGPVIPIYGQEPPLTSDEHGGPHPDAK